jgi:hypothetical protein
MIALAVAASATILSQAAAPTAKGGDGAEKRIDPARFAAAVYKHTGGRIVRPGTLLGRIVCVDCQDAVPREVVAEASAAFAALAKVRVNVEPGSFAWPNPAIVGNASLFVVDDATLPPLVSAPESRWAMVNVAPLRIGRGAEPAYFTARFRKELTRGFALLAGAQDSSFPNSLLGCITDPARLDSFADTRLPVDVAKRFASYVRGYGITPAEEVSYLQAVKEGWAPSPTNDVQQAIWDKVHAMPTEPIRIKPEAKKVKE